jgi:PAS domain S-box-containing protein
MEKIRMKSAPTGTAPGPLYSVAGRGIQSRFAIWAVLVTMLAFTLLAWRATDNAVSHVADANFEQHVQDVKLAIQGRMVSNEHVLLGGAALFAASGQVGRQEWHRYVRGLSLDRYYPGILAMAFSKVVAPDERGAFIAAVRAEGFPDFTIRPAGTRPLYTSLVYLEPFSSATVRAFGYDMLTEPTRRAAMERARDSGAPSMTGKLKLVQEHGAKAQAGMLILVPVYRNAMPVASVAQRRAALDGYVSSAFRMDDLMQGILGQRTNPLIDLHIYDGLEPKPAHLMHDSHPGTMVAAQFERSVHMEFGGHTWTILVRGTPQFEASIDRTKPRLVLLGGLVVTALLLAVLWAFQTGRERALQLASRMTVNLRDSEQRFRALVEHAPVGIFLTDVDGNCELVNGRWSELTGLSLEHALGQGWTLALHPADRPQVFGEWNQAVQEGREFSLEFRYMRRGEEVWVSSQAVALTNDEGEKTGFIGTVFDLTERMKVELLKNEFISTVSHELRTPLTSIRGSLGLVIGGAVGPIPQPAAKLLAIAASNSERLVRLINDILDIEKLDSGKLHFELRRCELQLLVEQAVAVNQGYAQQLGTSLAIRCALPGAAAMLDADRTLQVLTNLLSNAAKFSPPGQPVEVALTRRQGNLRVEVRDRGPGIPLAFRERIFQKFAQADSSDTRAKGGTGLGLNISKAIIERQGGTIGFDSAPEQGATFYFEVPEAGAPQPVVPAVALPRTLPLPLPRPAPACARILVCEDDPDIANLLCLLLQQGGFATDMAHSAAQARTLLAANSYLAMTLDIGLPDQDGLSFAQGLRQQEATRHLPIIVVSAQAENARLSASALGLVDWLTKPIDEPRLAAALQQVVRGAGAGAGAGTGKKRILHVEDDADVVHVVATLLGPEVEVVQAESVAAAQRLLQSEYFCLVILDIGLADGSGAGLLPLLHSIDKNFPVIIFSGQEVEQTLSEQVSAVLVKARTADDTLLHTITQLIERSTQGASSRDFAVETTL